MVMNVNCNNWRVKGQRKEIHPIHTIHLPKAQTAGTIISSEGSLMMEKKRPTTFCQTRMWWKEAK